MATVLMETFSNSNDLSQDVFSKNDVILYATQLENELHRVQSQNIQLMQQLNELETENRSKDEMLSEITDENISFKQEIQRLRRQKNSKQNSATVIENRPRSYSTNSMSARSVSTLSVSSHNTINTIHEDKGPKIFSGYMFKKGKFNTEEYQNRYFVLYANNTLHYYQEASDEDDSCLGEICLYSVYDIKEDPNNHIFCLITGKTIFTLRCDIDEDYNRWIQIIKSIIYPKIVCKGWLHKKSNCSNTKWKLRYFTFCQLMDYAQHFELRYYEDEKCKKYKGNINCDQVIDIKLLSTNSIQKYGRDKVIELMTEHRVYVVAANDTQIRNSWYKSLKKVLFQSTEETKPKPPNMKRSVSRKRPPLINILQPISEHTPFQPQPKQKDTRMGLVQSSDNNQDIDTDEWRHCFASISPQVTPCISPAISPNISPNGSPKGKRDISIDKYHIMLSRSDTEELTPRVTNLSANANAILAKAFVPLASSTRNYSTESESEAYQFAQTPQSVARGRGSTPSSPWSYMSNNSVLLMDINSECNRLGAIINDFDHKSAEVYDKMSYDQTKGCEMFVHSPFEFFSGT